jgi:hypothetical protein
VLFQMPPAWRWYLHLSTKMYATYFKFTSAPIYRIRIPFETMTCFQVVPKVLQLDLPRCETFSKLKQLHLGEWFLTGGCYPLIYLLRHSPSVEKVILQLDTVRHPTPSLCHVAMLMNRVQQCFF